MKPKLKSRILSFAKPFFIRIKTVVEQLRPVLVEYSGNKASNRKRALLSYLPRSVNMRDNHRFMKWHSNWWECRETARILCGLGYNVDAVAVDNTKFVPVRKYDLVVDIGRNLQRFAPHLPKTAKKFLFLPGAYPIGSCRAELERVLDFEKRTNHFADLRLGVIPAYAIEKSLFTADAIMSIGDEWVFSTYPERFRRKFTKVQISSSYIGTVHKQYPPGRPLQQTFLFYNTRNLVWKGLDLILEAFSRHSDWRLEVCGGAEKETAFMTACKPWLDKANVRFHGFVTPSSEKFQSVLDLVDAFITPSCTDSNNTSSLTCMSTGLYPIISRQTGVDLPDEYGIRLRDASRQIYGQFTESGTSITESELTAEAVEEAVLRFLAKPPADIAAEAAKCREHVLEHHSREAYRDSVKKFLETHL